MLDNQLFLIVLKNEYLSRNIYQFVHKINNLKSSAVTNDNIIINYNGGRNNVNYSFKLRDMSIDTILRMGAIRLYMHLLSLPKEVRSRIRSDGSQFKTTLNIHLLKRFFGACKEYDDYIKVFERYKHVFHVALNHPDYCCNIYDGGLLDYSTKTGNLRIVKHMYDQGFRPHKSISSLNFAIDGGSVEVVRYVMEELKVLPNQHACVCAIKDLEILKLLETKIDRADFESYKITLLNASVSTNLQTFNYLKESFNYNMDPSVPTSPNNSTINPIFDHLLGSGIPFERQGVIDTACLTNKLEDVKLAMALLSQQYPNGTVMTMSNHCTRMAMITASSLGNFEMVEYLHIQISAPPSREAIEVACTNGFEDIVSFLIQNTGFTQEKDLSSYFSLAALNGHLSLVQYLNEYQKQQDYSQSFNGGLTNLVIGVSQKNHFHVVRYLQDIWSCQQTINHFVLNWAIVNGSWDYVKDSVKKYSHLVQQSNTQPGYNLPLASAAHSGNIDILTLLIEHGYTLTEDVLNSAITKDQLHIVQHLEKLGMKVSTTMSLEVALSNNSTDTIQYIHEQDPSLISTVSPPTIILVIKSNYFETAKWIFKLRPLGPTLHTTIMNNLSTLHPQMMEFVLDIIIREGYECQLTTFQNLFERCIRDTNVTSLKTLSKWMDKNCKSLKSQVSGLLQVREINIYSYHLIHSLWKERLITATELRQVVPINQNLLMDQYRIDIMTANLLYSLLYKYSIGWASLMKMTYYLKPSWNLDFPTL